MHKLAIKTIQDLTAQELKELNSASKREFKVSLPPREELKGRYFFLLKDEGKILAMGQLLPIEPIKFNGEEFFVWGIGGIIANEKGKGYGKQIMIAIRDFLISQNKTGIGFNKLFNKGFYEKCGFNSDIPSLKRFIYKGKFQADLENECIFYLDGSDHFMEKVLKNPNKDVILPIPPIW